jgi:uncharacterized DUF497 family protein
MGDICMSKGKVFECEVTVSSAVKQKLITKHNIEIWEVEEIVYDDTYAFSLTHKDCYFIYGQTFSGRYLLVLARVLSSAEVTELGYVSDANILKIITARDMNLKQRKMYNQRKGIR